MAKSVMVKVDEPYVIDPLKGNRKIRRFAEKQARSKKTLVLQGTKNHDKHIR